ncbi:hypothetical protein OEZ86_008473 [Tetradesmus obliquus]|nr:hypothetical protein OEZ86_008473 [Tetradesmus obliquus]
MEACCYKCGKRGGGAVKLQRCSACKCVHYCGTACRDADWASHKKYCKRLIFVKKAELGAFVDGAKKADPNGSEAYCAAKQAAAGDKALEGLVLVAPLAAQNFVQACEADVLPSCEAEEQIWGLWGNPRSSEYQRTLIAYQRALKYGDLGAQQLMECLLARPAASKALTKALRKVRFVMTEDDALEIIMRSLDGYGALVDGLEVVSEFDQWPLNQS